MTRIPRSFTIPDTIEGVSGLLTARKWERAAIIYAWTKPDKPGPKGDTGKVAGIYGIAEFAALGIVSERTVRNYRNAWVWLVEQDLAPMVEPGDTVDFGDLATLDFPPTGNPAYSKTPYDEAYEAEAEKAGISADAAKRAGSNKAGAKAAYKADPAFRNAVHEAREELTHERAERAIKDAEKRGVSREDITGPAEPQGSAFFNLLDYAEEEILREDAIRELVAIAETGKARMQQAAARFGHTGVANEVDLMHQMTAALTDWQWAATSFTVEPAGEPR